MFYMLFLVPSTLVPFVFLFKTCKVFCLTLTPRAAYNEQSCKIEQRSFKKEMALARPKLDFFGLSFLVP